MSPVRIQRQRTKGWRMPEGAVYVGRPSRWGNPFVLGETYMWLSTGMPFPVPTPRDPGEYEYGLRVVRLDDRQMATAWFRAWVEWTENDISVNVMAVLGGRDLACWCPLDQPCHADVLLDLANGEQA